MNIDISQQYFDFQVQLKWAAWSEVIRIEIRFSKLWAPNRKKSVGKKGKLTVWLINTVQSVHKLGHFWICVYERAFALWNKCTNVFPDCCWLSNWNSFFGKKEKFGGKGKINLWNDSDALQPSTATPYARMQYVNLYLAFWTFSILDADTLEWREENFVNFSPLKMRRPSANREQCWLRTESKDHIKLEHSLWKTIHYPQIHNLFERETSYYTPFHNRQVLLVYSHYIFFLNHFPFICIWFPFPFQITFIGLVVVSTIRNVDFSPFLIIFCQKNRCAYATNMNRIENGVQWFPWAQLFRCQFQYYLAFLLFLQRNCAKNVKKTYG